MAEVRLNWRGDEVSQRVKENVAKTIGQFGMVVETSAKASLSKGHGVITGTLRRSIHTAIPGYNWSADAEGSDQGGMAIDAAIEGSDIRIQVGSGLRYAMAVHQGHGSFSGYHYLTEALDKCKGQIPGILANYKVDR
jgi:hypothetical protein